MHNSVFVYAFANYSLSACLNMRLSFCEVLTWHCAIKSSSCELIFTKFLQNIFTHSICFVSYLYDMILTVVKNVCRVWMMACIKQYIYYMNKKYCLRYVPFVTLLEVISSFWEKNLWTSKTRKQTSFVPVLMQENTTIIHGML